MERAVLKLLKASLGEEKAANFYWMKGSSETELILQEWKYLNY